MKVWVKGGGPVTLTQKDYVGQGGQGVMYARGGTAYKVYHDPSKMLPVGKIQELTTIQDPRVVKPQQILVDDKGNPVGYTARFVDNAYALCQTFPKDFRSRTGLTHDMVEELVRKFREGVENVHKAGILIVDLNEMNFLVDHGFSDIFFIDVDSYQTAHYPAPALMESVRDWSVQNHQWSQNSDWYSFAVVTFQMFTGIHPFKGKYHGADAQFAGKIPGDLDADSFAVTRRRMQAGISVFDPNVRVPGAAFPVSVIPVAYKAWYEALFRDGKRGAPPLDFTAAVIILPVVKTLTGTNQLDIMELGEYDSPIRGFWSDGTQLTVVTDKTVYLGKNPVCPAPASVVGIAWTPKASRAVLVEGTSPPKLFNLTDRKDIPLAIGALEAVVHADRLYVRGHDRVYEVLLSDLGSQVIASTKETAQTLEHATRLYPGVVVQNLLGSTYVSLLIASGSAQQVRLKELDEYRILDARYEGNVLMVVGEKKGQYDRLVFRFDGAGTYDVREVKDIQPTGLNFTVLDHGICVCLNEDEKLELFSARSGSTTLKTVEDPALSGDMRLGKMGGQVVFSRGTKLYKMKMR